MAQEYYFKAVGNWFVMDLLFGAWGHREGPKITMIQV